MSIREHKEVADTHQAKYLKSEMSDNYLLIERILRMWCRPPTSENFQAKRLFAHLTDFADLVALAATKKVINACSGFPAPHHKLHALAPTVP